MGMSYRKGRRLEYRVRDLLKAKGWVVIRAAASRPVDLVGMKAGRVVLIECKYNRRSVSHREVRSLLVLARRAGAEAAVALARKWGPITIKSLTNGRDFVP